MKNLTKLVDFSHDPAILHDDADVNDVFGVSLPRMHELLKICETAQEQAKDRGEDIFDATVAFLKLVEADAFTPQELACYATIGFAAALKAKKVISLTLKDLAEADPEIKRRLPLAMMKVSLGIMRQES